MTDKMTAQETSLTIDTVCPTGDLAAFIDGELGLSEVAAMEQHLAVCQSCRRELNIQKLFLGELNSRLTVDILPEPPADFARIIAANAEGSVSGLSSVGERKNALSVVAGLAVLTLAASAFASGSSDISLLGSFDKFIAIATAAAGVVQSLFVGLMVLVRSFAVRVPADLAALVIVPAGILAVIPVFDRLRSLVRRH